MLKKIDFYAQVIIVIAMVILAIVSLFIGSYFFGALLLLMPLGLWQLISALFYAASKRPQTDKKILNRYWMASATGIILLILGILLRDNNGNQLAMVLITIALSICFLTALYYVYLYKKYFLHAKSAEENSGIGSV